MKWLRFSVCRNTRDSRRDCAAAAAIGALALLVGCAGTQPTYEGPRRQASEIAIFEAGRSVILGFDDTDIRGRRFELLPRSTRVRFQLNIPGAELDPALTDRRAFTLCEMSFVPAAGHTYRVRRTRAEYEARSRDFDTVIDEYGYWVRIIDVATGDDVPLLSAKCDAFALETT